MFSFEEDICFEEGYNLSLGNGYRLLSKDEVGSELPIFFKFYNSDYEVHSLNDFSNFDDYPYSTFEVYLYAYVTDSSCDHCNISDATEKLLGSFRGWYFDASLLERYGWNLSEAMDDCHEETYNFYNYNIDYLVENFDFDEFYDSLFYIHTLKVDKDFRGLGIGSYLMRNIKNILNGVFRVFPKLICVQAYPVESYVKDDAVRSEEDVKNNKIFTDKLTDFYVRSGFKKINVDNDCGYSYLYFDNSKRKSI